MPSGGMRGLNVALGLVTVGLLVAAVIVLAVWPEGAAVLLFTIVTTIASLALVWLILPSRYEIWPDRVRLIFPMWGWDLPFDTIDTAQHGKRWEAYAYTGVRFATSPGQSIVVRRRGSNLFKRPHAVISPADRAVFLRELDKAVRDHASRA